VEPSDATYVESMEKLGIMPPGVLPQAGDPGTMCITRTVRGQKGIDLQGDHIRHGFLAAIVAAHDELKFDMPGEAPPVG
jgi:hypothetical protein